MRWRRRSLTAGVTSGPFMTNISTHSPGCPAVGWTWLPSSGQPATCYHHRKHRLGVFVLEWLAVGQDAVLLCLNQTQNWFWNSVIYRSYLAASIQRVWNKLFEITLSETTSENFKVPSKCCYPGYRCGVYFVLGFLHCSNSAWGALNNWIQMSTPNKLAMLK